MNVKEFFPQAGVSLGKQVLIDKSIEHNINSSIIKGCIKQAQLEEGLYAEIWNCEFAEPLEVKASTNYNKEKYYSLAYLFTPGIAINSINSRQSGNHEEQIHVCFYDNGGVEFSIAGGQAICIVIINMSEGWLKKQFRYGSPKYSKLINSLRTHYPPELRIDTCSAVEYLHVSEILNKAGGENILNMFIHSRILMLVAAFFENFGEEKSLNKNIHRFKQIKEVENILIASLTKELPSIKDLASRFLIGESVLQRYFKIIFGMNIYEYYLQKKMDLAQRLIIENNLGVDQVAVQLNYHTTSSFISIFKKHFGYLPGSIRKSRN